MGWTVALGGLLAAIARMHDSACSCHHARGAITHRAPAHPADVAIARELVRIRGAYRYADRHVLLGTYDELRRRISEETDPLELRCWLGDDAMLHLDVTVPMFADHAIVFGWCDLLERTAVAATLEVNARSL